MQTRGCSSHDDDECSGNDADNGDDSMLKNMLRRWSPNHYKSHAYTKREIAVQLNAIIKEDLQLFLDLSNGRDFTTLQRNH